MAVDEVVTPVGLGAEALETTARSFAEGRHGAGHSHGMEELSDGDCSAPGSTGWPPRLEFDDESF